MAHPELRPSKDEHQVYISKVARAEKFHPEWCSSVNGLWLSGADVLTVVEWDDAIRKGRTLCSLCREMISDGKQH